MSEAQWSGEAKYRALLAVAEAANSRRDLGSVLDVVATALEGLVPIDAIGVKTRDGERIQPLGLRAVLERVERVAGTDSTVLVSGETGTGKELAARGSTAARAAPSGPSSR